MSTVTTDLLHRCPSCRRWMTTENFHMDRSNASGLACYCKLCTSMVEAERREKNREDNAMLSDDMLEGITRRCSRCGEVKPITAFVRNVTVKLGHGYLCLPCANAAARESRARRRQRELG